MNGEKDISTREGLSRAGWIPSSPEDNFVEWRNFDFSVVERPNVSSLFFTIDYPTYYDFLADPDNEAGDYYVTDNRGFPALIDCLANNFSSNPSTDKRIHLETVVNQIEYGNTCVCAKATERGEVTRYCARYGMVTFSVGVLKEQSSTLFSPTLPEAKIKLMLSTSSCWLFIAVSMPNTRTGSGMIMNT